ncbi:hypothetical protein ACFL3G_00200 [Planctomycetota bacterium]
MTKEANKVNLPSWANNNILTIAIAAVIVVIILMFFWDRQQQRAIELRRIETKIDLLEEWGVRPQQQNTQQNTQSNFQQNNTNAQGNGGRIF